MASRASSTADEPIAVIRSQTRLIAPGLQHNEYAVVTGDEKEMMSSILQPLNWSLYTLSES